MLAKLPFNELTVAQVKQQVGDWIYDRMGGVVQTGPFLGMKLLQERTWESECLGAKILGCYEQELHHTIEYEILRLAELSHPKIVNIGCAEGYYAVGMALRLPGAGVWVVDVPDAMGIATRAAAANGVRIAVGEPLISILAEPDLIICDCEGAEVEYLDKGRFPDLAHSTIIVECHDWEGHSTTQILYDRFCNTHNVMQLLTGPRNPTNFECLNQIHQTAQWILMDEGRPGTMRWCIMRPHAAD